MFGEKEKSILAFQVKGRLSNYISNIDDCEPFFADSQTKLDKTFEMTECIHSLLQHTLTNCISENKAFIDNLGMPIEKEVTYRKNFSFKWTPILDAKSITGIAEIRFFIPSIELFNFSNFKKFSIESLTDIVINLMTLSNITNHDNSLDLYIIKTKLDGNIKLTEEFITNLKLEIDKYCTQNNTSPTMIYLRHKKANGHYADHYANFDTKERTTNR